MNKAPTALVIGDPHFKDKNVAETRMMAQQIVEIAKKHHPTFIVILGDTLHYHNIAKNAPFKEAYFFIKSLANVAPVYILIGNHDYINNKQFHSDNHFFLPYREWESVCVVDKPFFAEYGEFSFVMCPYVPTGRFKESLNLMFQNDGVDWQMADCIFAHQDFKGYFKGGSKICDDGDEWDPDFPPVISGHVHDSQVVQGNVYYVGTPIQHTFKEKPNKSVWIVSFGEEEAPYFKEERVSLNIKGKKTLYMTLQDIESFDLKEVEKWDIRMVVTCTSAEFRAFRQSIYYKKLSGAGVKLEYDVQKLSSDDLCALKSREEVSYPRVLKEVVRKKSDNVREAYTCLLGETLGDEES